MKKINVDAIEDTNILARDVCGPSGNILLSKGITLNRALAKRLKNWGIAILYIEGEEENTSKTSATEISPDSLKAHLQQKFSHVSGNSIMRDIFEAIYKFRLSNNLN